MEYDLFIVYTLKARERLNRLPRIYDFIKKQVITADKRKEQIRTQQNKNTILIYTLVERSFVNITFNLDIEIKQVSP